MGIGVTGGVNFIISRSVLHQNQLHLDRWYGFGEVVSYETMLPDRLDQKIWMSKDSTLAVLFSRNEKSQAGVLLSRNPKKPSGFFFGPVSGKFETFHKIENLEIPSGYFVV